MEFLGRLVTNFMISINESRNAAEACFAITAVIRGESVLAQTALTGSLLSNCLMIFGTCLLCGGVQNAELFYPVIIAKVHAQLLVVSLVSIALPAAFRCWSQGEIITKWLAA